MWKVGWKVDNCRDLISKNFNVSSKGSSSEKEHISFRKCSEHVSFSDKGPLLETFEFCEIRHGSYQSLIFLNYLSLSAQYLILISLIGLFNAWLDSKIYHPEQHITSILFSISHLFTLTNAGRFYSLRRHGLGWERVKSYLGGRRWGKSLRRFVGFNSFTDWHFETIHW